MKKLSEMKTSFPIAGSPSGAEKYAGEPVRIVDGIAQAARYLVDGWYVFDDHDKQTEINRYKHRNGGKEPGIVELDKINIAVADDVKYSTADEARAHIKGGAEPPTIANLLKRLEKAEAEVAVAKTRIAAMEKQPER